MDPRSAPGGLRSGPRGAKTAPRGAKSTPRAPQEPPKRRKKGAKKVTIFGWALGVASGRPPGAILARFWRLRGAFWSHFRRRFEASWHGSKRAKRSQLQAPGEGRAAAEQGHRAIHSACNLDARVALATSALLLLVALCSRFSCRSCFSPGVLRRLQCLRLSR